MRRTALVVLLAAAMPLIAATEKWVDSYNKGVMAVNGRNYKYAAIELQKAIAEMPNEGVSLRTRSQIITYVPHFWLGIAKFNLGDVDGALREWKTSEEQGAIGKTEYYSNLKDWVARAQAEKKRNAQSAASGSKKAATDAISRALAKQVDALSAGGDRTDSYRTAQRLLFEANKQLTKAGTDIGLYNAAAETAEKASTLFAAAAEEGKKQKAARAAAPPKPKPAPPREEPKVEVVPVQTPPPQPAKVEPKPVEPPPPVVEVESEAKVSARLAVQQLRRNLGDAGRSTREADNLRKQLESAKNDAEFQNIARVAGERNQELTKKIAEAKAPPIQVATPVPGGEMKATIAIAGPDLRSAYRAFALGDLTASEQLLTKMLGERPIGEAFLLRGCTRYTRAMLSREPDMLLAAATDDFKAALQQNRGLRLDSRAFSPKLIAFFEQVRNGL